MKRFVLALLVLSALPFPAASKDAFKNLPGVKDPAEEKSVEIDTVCTSKIQRAWPSRFPERNGLAERSYSCEDGSRISVGANRPPNLIEYRKFKQYYQSN